MEAETGEGSWATENIELGPYLTQVIDDDTVIPSAWSAGYMG